MMDLFANFIPLVFALTFGGLSDSVAIPDRSQDINCSFAPYDILTTKKDSSHDKCCCKSPDECMTYLSTTHNCDPNTGEIRPRHSTKKNITTNSDLSINCSFGTNDKPTTKSDPSHDRCCCTNSGECTTYLSTTHNCNHDTGEIKPLPSIKGKVTTNSDLSINCSFATYDIPTTKIHPSHDMCCCKRLDECTTYLSTTHYCDPKTEEIRPLGTNCLGLSSTKNRRSGYQCCRNNTAYMPDVMSCDLSSGEVTLKSHAKFASLKLCRKKLPRALDSAPAPALSNKEIHIEGRVEKVRVDIGANYLIIDLVPFRFNSATKHSPCFREDRGRLQVRVMLPPKRWCQPLDEIQEYLYDKTLDIWTDFQSLRNCRPKRSGFQIPFESENYWMMVSQRVFYSKR